MNTAAEQIESSSDIERLRDRGVAELADQFSKARAQIRKMIDMRLDRKLLGRIDASDVVQEAFIEASRRLPEYLDAPKVSPYMWLRQIGRQVLAVHYREHVGTAGRTVHREAEPGKCPIVNSESVAGQMAASVASPHSVIAKAELLQKILILIESMAPEDREVLSLKQFEQLTFQEVALELNVSMEAAKKRYQRAVIRLGQIAAHLKGSS
jgi:RNA polymerase sigma-70 factor, ECF subfamily